MGRRRLQAVDEPIGSDGELPLLMTTVEVPDCVGCIRRRWSGGVKSVRVLPLSGYRLTSRDMTAARSSRGCGERRRDHSERAVGPVPGGVEVWSVICGRPDVRHEAGGTGMAGTGALVWPAEWILGLAGRRCGCCCPCGWRSAGTRCRRRHSSRIRRW
jgi:hypothetical protein